MALLLLTEIGGDTARAWLSFQRSEIDAGQWWRLLTANFVHLGWYHWALNEIGLFVLVLLCPERLSPAVWLRRLVLLSLGMSAGLYFFMPSLQHYVGLSGVIHGLFLLGLIPQVLKRDLIALGCVTYLVGKIAWELYAGAPVSDQQALGGSVIVQSHLFGCISALIYGLIFRSYTCVETWRRK